MQRIINDPDNIVDEMLKGFLKAQIIHEWLKQKKFPKIKLG